MDKPVIKIDSSDVFESEAHQNGMLYWFATEFLKALGYDEYKPTIKPIQKALQVCLSTNIDTSENIQEVWRDIDGKRVKDFKLSRFACYLVAMNADTKKPEVSRFQAYFAAYATQLQQILRDQSDIERVSLRSEITDHEKMLASTAKTAGIENYAYFQNKGYQGLYNMPIHKIRELKNLPSDKPLFDFMGAEELGANIFRITQTQAKIKRNNINGQNNLEKAAYEVGSQVRQAIREMGGTMPENLDPCEDIKSIKSDIKKTNKAFAKNDKRTLPGKK